MGSLSLRVVPSQTVELDQVLELPPTFLLAHPQCCLCDSGLLNLDKRYTNALGLFEQGPFRGRLCSDREVLQKVYGVFKDKGGLREILHHSDCYICVPSHEEYHRDYGTTSRRRPRRLDPHLSNPSRRFFFPNLKFMELAKKD